jgi:hypothetical protein
MRALVATIALSLSVSGALAQVVPAYDPANYTTMLVPLNVYDAADPLLGEHGSVWESSLLVRNGSAQSVWFNQEGPLCVTEGCGGIAHLDAGVTLQVQLARAAAEGALLHVEKSEAERVFFEMLLSSPTAACNGDVSVPIVREERFLDAEYEFLDVPLMPGARVMLRVYDVGGQPEGSDVRVVVSDATTGATLLDTMVHANFQENHPETEGFPGFPNYVALAHLESYATHAQQHVRITVTPSTPGMRYWTMMSITDDAAQGVRLISPN